MFNSSILQINIDKFNLKKHRSQVLINKDFALVILLFRLNYSSHLMCCSGELLLFNRYRCIVKCSLSKSSLFGSFIDGSGVSTPEESTPSSDYAERPAAYPQALGTFNERSTHAIATLISDEDSDIEVLVGRFSVSFDDATQILLESAMRRQGDITVEEESDDEFISLASESLGRWEDEGGACSKVLSPVDDYVVLDGYETDVECELSNYEELQQSL